MPKRTDINKIMIIGSGPIIIGQACEFDYSGAQGCKVLKENGYKVILVNSNPATIMTDPEFSDRTYIEPIEIGIAEKIIQKEQPDAILPTLGGQTALNLAVKLYEEKILQKYSVELIGASYETIKKAEDRRLFRDSMLKIGLDLPKSRYAYSLDEAHEVLKELGLPCVIRSSFNLGGTGSGMAYNIEEFERHVSQGISQSMIHEVLIEESVYGWKEYELEVMRDSKDNCVIVCSVENVDPMGIHTGDSITVAPTQTLSDQEYQKMRNMAIAVMREIGIECGGSNIQFAVDPKTGRIVVIEMNPRVSRSSALASKATGFPIAKIAALLAVGYTLDEIPNDITKKTPACFEPTIDYVVVKIPRWAFEKFRDADETLTVQMKSVGEVMSIGRTFKESFQKALRSLEQDRNGLGWDRKDLMMNGNTPSIEKIREKLMAPNAERLFYARYALKSGMSVNEVSDLTKIDPWFIENIAEIVNSEQELLKAGLFSSVSKELLLKVKKNGFSDKQLATMFNTKAAEIRNRRKELNIIPGYKLVDTCAAEFEAKTPYYYSTYDGSSEHKQTAKKKIAIIGGGPNRIGQGIEFDYCCVHAAIALRKEGYEVLMINSNPETVSTDYDVLDQLYFEPLTVEDILNICETTKPEGIIVQFGGQTPLNLSRELKEAGVNIIGTPVEQIDRAEDRQKFKELIEKLRLVQPISDVAYNFEEAKEIASRIGYPVVIRPSYVLGGRAMEICYDFDDLGKYIKEATDASPEHPVLIDKFIEDAIEVDVDALGDSEEVYIGGVLEHIEMAGIHSGDSAITLPPFSLSDRQVEEIKRITTQLALELKVKGLINIQFAVKANTIYVLEVNPRASRTVPFVSKATGVPMAKLAASVVIGRKLKDFNLPYKMSGRHIAVKESVFPFKKFAGVDVILGPEMRSTGEVMGIDMDFGRAYAKAQLARGHGIPTGGTVFVSVKDQDKRDVIFLAKRLSDLGFKIVSTPGTGKVLENAGVPVRIINKIKEGRPNALDLIINHEVDLIINTPSGKGPVTDEGKIRALATSRDVHVITTIQAAQAMVNAIEACKKRDLEVHPLQEYY